MRGRELESARKAKVGAQRIINAYNMYGQQARRRDAGAAAGNRVLPGDDIGKRWVRQVENDNVVRGEQASPQNVVCGKLTMCENHAK